METEESRYKIQKELGQGFDKLNTLVNYYLENPGVMDLAFTRRGNKYKIKKEFREMNRLKLREKFVPSVSIIKFTKIS